VTVSRTRRARAQPGSERILAAPRVVVEAVFPEVDGGRFPAKRTVGERVAVRASVFADGHDAVGGVVCYRRAGEAAWREAPLALDGNDEFVADFDAEGPGMMEYTVEAWIDAFTTWRSDLQQRVYAGWDVASELLVGAELLRAKASRASRPDSATLRFAAQRLGNEQVDTAARVQAALSPELAACAMRWPDRSAATRYRTLELLVDRERARFGAWYELFPRSTGAPEAPSGTFADVAARLPDLAAMGFDVLYLPPVHPIGETNRKGPENRLRAAPGDPGSPWAIGSAAGGHTAVHPDLGTLDEFDALVEAARGHGIEIALDVALQCSPDHPWVQEHPEWFRRRPDGSIAYAENPPKRYEDIFPLDLACADWEALWEALRGVFEFWIGHGVLIFRVDNPHTKPYPFWSWVIAEIRAAHPEVVFLAEAFTRPKRMYGLAKRGFNQSYSYFTWRNTKEELTSYFRELSTPPVSEFFRPNLFANTPDILHEFLQTGGRPAFAIRAVLAATLGPSYGIYSGFELAECEAVPGTEEYRHSEKYERRVRDWDAPGNLKPLITRLNSLRREHRALQFTRDLWFLPVENDGIIAYMKAAPEGGEHVLTVVNLDPQHSQEGWVGLPLPALGLTAGEPFEVNDVLNGVRYEWDGEWNRVRLDPATEPARIFVLQRRGMATIGSGRAPAQR
jgi:starch synthase (maltosyl-transferring)